MARINFVELPTADVATARQFYTAAFGFALTDFGPSYTCTMTGDVDLGLQADQAEATGAPLAVIAVDDLDKTAAAVVAAGAPFRSRCSAFPVEGVSTSAIRAATSWPR